jgi:UDP-glucuronate decarboxylase
MTSTSNYVSKIEAELISSRVNLESFNHKRVLITGGTGMIGSYLTEALCKACALQGVSPKEINLVIRQGSHSKISNLDVYPFVKFSDWSDGDSDRFRGFQFLIHAASPASPLSYPSLAELNKVNVGMLTQMITKDTERVLFISSGEVYGSAAPTPVSEEFVGKINQLEARSDYPLAKIEAEKLGTDICTSLGIDFRIVRLFHSFGPGVKENDGRSFADFLWQCARGNLPTLFSKGNALRTFLYSEDAVAAMLAILSKEKLTGPINVGSDKSVSILDFASMVSKISGYGGKVQYLLEKQNYTASPNQALIPDTSKLRSMGWNQQVGLEESISRTLFWIKNQIN